MHKEILDNLNTAVIIVDRALQLKYLNPAAQNLLQVSEIQAKHKSLDQLTINVNELLSDLNSAASHNNTLTRRNLVLQINSGQELHVDMTIASLTESEDKYLVELHPIERLLKINRSEEQLFTQEATHAVIRSLAHEIKNPLGGLRGAAQLLDRALPDDELKEYTGVIITEADRLRDLVDRLLGPTRQLVTNEVNVHEVLEHLCHLINAETDQRITIVRDYDPSLPEIPADRTQLTQALLNIMRNAIQASDSLPLEHCKITLVTRSRRQFTIAKKRHKLVVRIDIIDNGEGISAELQQAIFIPMVTGRPTGTGLGLSISQNIVKQHGGLLECKSKPGRTRFSLYLPMESYND